MIISNINLYFYRILKNTKEKKKRKMNKNLFLIALILIEINCLNGLNVFKIFSKNLKSSK